MKNIKSKSIKNYLIKNKSLINMTLETKGFKAFKDLLLELLNKGLNDGEITDKDEVYMLLDVIPNMKQSHLYSTYVTLVTCMKIGR